MAIPKLISADHIKSLREKEEQSFNNMVIQYDQSKRKSDDTKNQWLAVYSKCLSVVVACKQVGVSTSTYKRWRNTDPDFCEALNLSISSARDELLGSALVRAIGYLRKDPETGEIETDATGKPIYHGASDTLAKELLRLEAEDSKSHADVIVNIDFGTLLGSPNVVQLPTKSDPVTLEHDGDIDPDPAA